MRQGWNLESSTSAGRTMTAELRKREEMQRQWLEEADDDDMTKE